MTGEDAAGMIALLERNGIEVYVDGGWAVDALLGEQTRRHKDLDIAIPHRYVPRLRELLGGKGYTERVEENTWECNFVLVDADGREVDVHSYTLDESGANVFGVPYQREYLNGSGVIAGYGVRCISPEWLVKFHTGYVVDEDDYHDVRLLCERFGLEVPGDYRRFESEGAGEGEGGE